MRVRSLVRQIHVIYLCAVTALMIVRVTIRHALSYRGICRNDFLSAQQND